MATPLPSIPGYNVLAVAGQGGMGTVYKAEQESPRRTVAIKVLSGAHAEAGELAAFRREADLIAGLEHPHILPLYDFGELDGMPYLVLRYLNGGSAADRLRRGPLELGTAARWVEAVADALDFAHQKGIVHKDVKPSNVLLDDAGESANAYLTDFGIAGALAATGGAAPTGSAAYMSPEQGRGEPVDGRADIYALSVMLFEMLTGRKPYTAETALGLIVRHINDPIPSARELNLAVPPAVDELIRWGMAKHPGERPQTGGEFARYLRQAIAQPNAPLRAARPDEPTLAAARTISASRRPQQPSAALRIVGLIVVAGACLLSAAVLGGGTLAALLITKPTAVLPTATKLPTAEPPTLAPSPVGQLLADDFSDPHSGFATSNDADGGVAYADGGLQFTVLREGVEWFSPSGRVTAADATIEVDVQQVSGPPKSEMAVLCRWKDFANYTAFAISGDGAFSIWQKRGGEVARLEDWQPAKTLQSGAGRTYHLRVVCVGSTLRFEADGALLAQTTDPQPIAGDVALMAGLREPGQLIVRFDSLVASR